MVNFNGLCESFSIKFMRESFLDTLIYEAKICLYLTNQKMLSTYKGEHHWTAEGDRGV